MGWLRIIAWPLAMVPGDTLLHPGHGEAPTPPLGALAVHPKGPAAQPRVLGAVFIPRLAGNEEGKALENQDARMLGSKEQQVSA